MTTQTALELTAEQVRSIIELIMADTVSSLVDDEEYAHLRDLLIQPGQDIVEKYRQVTASIFLFEEYRQLLPLVNQLIDNIGANVFSKMWEADESSTLREVLRCFGHGTSFWDDYDYKDFGFSEMPRLKITFENPYDVALQILDKIAEANSNEEETENPDFEHWLAENYQHSGGEYYLSKNPKDYLMYELHTLREQYNLDNKIEEVETRTFTIPAYLLSYFINGEFAGLEKEEFELIDRFLFVNQIDTTKGHFTYDDCDEPYFSWNSDLSDVGGSVVEIQWVEIRQL